jgi:RHS repeat-associated protein
LLTAIDYPAGMADVGYGYDAAGNVISVSDGLGSTTYGYDVLNRLDSRTRGSRVVDYGYSATNQVTSIDYWGRGAVGYGYDNAGRLASLTPWGGAATGYSYRSSGQLAGISRPNTVATTYSYDTAGRLTGLHHVHGGATTLNNIVYGLDANGNRDWMTDNDGLTDYVYDALYRLDAVTYPAIPGGPPAATIDYSMDEVGNRTGDGATTYSHDASDRITNAGFVYDANGNLLSDGVKSYEYDAANRLTKVISGSVTIDYAYDGWGNLIQESSNGITTEFVLDERGALPTILGEVRSDGAERLYAYGPEGFAAQMSVGGAVEYPLVDGLGSVRHLTDGTGNLLLSRSYDAFGNLRHSSGAGATRLGFTGELQDQMTGLVYLRARHYHPALGRFLQRDSFAGFQQRPQSLNRYAYTENNPVNHRDPSGHYVDTLLDIGFIVYDLHRIIQDNILRDCDNLGENLLALGLDVGGALIPFLTGAGMAGRAAIHADDFYDLVRYADELPGLSRFADDAVRHVDDVADSTRYGDDVVKKLDCPFNSFSADTPVMTAEGEVPISAIQVGDLVLAYDEETGETGYYTVTAVMVHIDPTIVYLTIDGETIETTPEHPFYVMESAPWLATGETKGRWVDAGELHVGDAVRQADGTTGMVQAVVVVERSQPMYNLTVAVAHTFFVGEQQWLVHNIDCDAYGKLKRTISPGEQAHHLNQNAAYKSVIPKEEGMAIPLRGNAFTEAGSPHYEAHKALEEFWDQYRLGGTKSGQAPTNAEYSRALEDALKKTGLSDTDIAQAIQQAQANRQAYGLLDEDFVPNIPRKIYQK